MEGHYLAFVDEIGTTVDGKIIYRFDFTQAPDVVWGDKWNSVPCSGNPKIQPDPQTLSITGRVISDNEYNIAKHNHCFSMQDCIDGIIAMFFSDPDEPNEIVLNFGEEATSVIDKLKKIGLELIDVKNVNQEQEDAIIDAAMGALDIVQNSQDDEGDDPFEGFGPEDF